MSFELFAAGTAPGRPYTFPVQEFPDEGDVFDAAEVVSELTRLDGVTDASQAALTAYADLNAVHLLKTSLATFKAMGRHPEVWLHASSPGVLYGVLSQPWCETARFRFEQGDENGLVRAFCQVLRRLRVNRWGIALGINTVLSDYLNNGLGHDPSILRIEVTV